MDIGKYNTLHVSRIVDFGLYLIDNDGDEVLLPSRYIEESVPEVGAEMTVFVYTDSDDRPVATTERPFATVGEVAFLQVVQVNKVGAFLDWGLMKDLLVPFREQKNSMRQGGIYPVYIYLDDATKRVVASAKIEKFIDNTIPQYKVGDRVRALVMQHAEPGFKVIVDNLHSGMLYHNELFREIVVGEETEAYVKQVRPDGKIDLTLSDRADRRTETLADDILDRLRMNGGRLALTDHSDPEEIKAIFHCSKKDFKKAIGHLYKQKKILIKETEITLIK